MPLNTHVLILRSWVSGFRYITIPSILLSFEVGPGESIVNTSSFPDCSSNEVEEQLVADAEKNLLVRKLLLVESYQKIVQDIIDDPK